MHLLCEDVQIHDPLMVQSAHNIEDAATDAGNAVEDACEDVTDRNC